MRLSDKELRWCQLAAEFPAQYPYLLLSLQLPFLILYTTVDRMDDQANSLHEGRPYRSHLHPACFSCKKRKSRCKTKSPAEVCVMCQAYGTECIFPRPGDPRPQRSSWPRKSPSNARSSRIIRGRNDTLQRPYPSTPTQSQGTRAAQRPIGSQIPAASPVEPPSGTAASSYISEGRTEGLPHLMGMVAEADDDSSHIVSPAVADDNDILESYLSATPSAQTRYLIRTSSKPNRHLGPVRFNVVPRRPLGVVANQSFAASKCEVIEKYMEPDIDEYLNLYVYPGLLGSHYNLR